MTEITRVPLQPIAKGAVGKIWIGALALALAGAGIAYAAMPASVDVKTLTAGAGESPTVDDVVLISYKGTLPDGKVFDEGKNLSKGFAHTVIDAGGRDSASLRAALLLAERAVVPVGASNLDAAAMTDLLEIVELAKDFNAGLDVHVLLMRIDPRTRDTGEMIDYLHEHKLRLLEARICERVAYRRAIGEGATVAELAKDPQAIAEMAALFKEIQR